ncbi:MAG: prepilin-type N-terminal cleavage/methylation domain-containing protein [Nitrospirae bacterium]|nr:prepilin-type N-terminal cleavage/methylation domain-containing protein [Nitrospirota bacterium]
MRSEKGFTLVELAIVLVIIGIILGAVLKGQDLINNAKAKRLVSDTQGLTAIAYTFSDRYGRFPGDCDNDGDLNYAALNATTAAFAAAAAPAFCYPPANAAANADDQWNEVIKAQLLSGAPRDLAKNLFNGARYFAGPAIAGVEYNIVVNRQVPCYSAKMMDTTIDGALDAGEGSIREISGGAIRIATDAWTSCVTEQTLVDVVYFFDKRPN